jgi:hypothetical protein
LRGWRPRSFSGVELTLTERAVRIAVSDPRGELRPSLREPTEDDMFGRGLLIVGQIANRWGVRELTVGKAVWCELDVVRRDSQGPLHADQLIPLVP